MDEVSGWLDDSGPGALACLVTAPEDLSFSLWTQDMFLAQERGTLLTPPRFERYQDLEAAEALARGADRASYPSRVYFEGGNVIAAGDVLLIGADTLAQNGGKLPGLARELDPTRQPVVLGCADPVPAETTRPTDRPEPGWHETVHWKVSEGSRQPLFHLDLFIAPAGVAETGRPRFLVGCARRGAALIDQPLRAEAMADQLDEIADQLEARGAHVVRNPMPLIWKDQPEERQRTWFHLPVNNVLAENRGADGCTIWMPCFASEAWPELAAVDDTNAAIWALMGYSVVRVPGLMALAENLGALHCMAKIVARG